MKTALRAFDIDWSISIPMRDGNSLACRVYRPRDTPAGPCIACITPYSTQAVHEPAAFFAGHGYTFVVVDSRGRGNSSGTFRPLIQEAQDGHDVVEWLAGQSWCNGKIAMWGGSYMGYVQWATIKEKPPHLASAVPTASAYPGIDFPMRRNISYPYAARWLSYVSERGIQANLFGDVAYWTAIYREHFENGRPYRDLARFAGTNEAAFLEWAAHPSFDDYWAAHSPSREDYAAIEVPLLTITGCHDDDQPGALAYYRNHMQFGRPEIAEKHHLVIGPWDHAGTRRPSLEFGGLTVGPASLVDINALHLDWYNWTLADGRKPGFLKDRVAYYVMGADEWRYAPTLDAVTSHFDRLYVGAVGVGADACATGSLGLDSPSTCSFDTYDHDPGAISHAEFEIADSECLVGQSVALTETGHQLVYHSAPFSDAVVISGFFRFSAWLSINRPDTDFLVSLYEVDKRGNDILLSFDQMRARYRSSNEVGTLIETDDPLLYDFDKFTFVSRRLEPDSRLRLVVGPLNSLSRQKNYNSGKSVSDETCSDIRPVTVRLFHGPDHPSVLDVPLDKNVGQSDGAPSPVAKGSSA